MGSKDTQDVGSLKSCSVVADDHPVLKGVNVRGATIDKLVELCVQEFDENGPVCSSCPMSTLIFHMHTWFISSEDLLTKFGDLYNASVNNLTSTRDGLMVRRSPLNKWAICHAVRFWMGNFGSEIKKNEELLGRIEKFQEFIDSDGDQALTELISVANIGKKEWSSQNSAEPKFGYACRSASLHFKDLSVAEIAEQITYLEYKALRRIPFLEWKMYAQSGKVKDTPNLQRYVQLFNGVTLWTQAMVLNNTSPEDRAKGIEKFLDIARHLHNLQSFNSLMAVVGALNHSVISRLHRTKRALSDHTSFSLKDMTEFLSSCGNYSNYRRALTEISGFCIPILGVQLKDIVSVHTAFPDMLTHHLVNINKLARLHQIISQLDHVKKCPPPVHPNQDLITMLRVSFQPRFTEDELYELSLAREPRSQSNLLSPSPSASQDSILFADWASGATPTLDAKIVDKHVNAMVDAVFKLYDKDKDMCISDSEFENIASNFPFIGSFQVIDTNCDGMITKEELKNYFLKINCQNLSKEFSHNFQEATYFTPTFCEHCGGLLWGVVKQGYRCKDCLINCHKNCRGQVVMECRMRPSTPHSSHQPVERTTSKAELIRNKFKSRLQKRRSSESTCSLDDSNDYCKETEYTILYNRLLKAEEEKSNLAEENSQIKSELAAANEKLQQLQQHIHLVRQQTISFILEQMDTLQVQKDTPV